jgi:hypothetical protein
MTYRDMISGLGPPPIPLGEKLSKEEAERLERDALIGVPNIAEGQNLFAGGITWVDLRDDAFIGVAKRIDLTWVAVSEAAAKPPAPSPTLPEHKPLCVSADGLRSGGGSQGAEDAAGERGRILEWYVGPPVASAGGAACSSPFSSTVWTYSPRILLDDDGA